MTPKVPDEPIRLSVVGGVVLTLDRRHPRIEGDLLVVDGVIDQLPAPRATEASWPVVDAHGCHIVPLVVETAEAHEQPDQRYADKCLTVGNGADFAVVKRQVELREVQHALIVRPSDLVALVLDGRVVAGHSLPLPRPGDVPLEQIASDDARLAVWIDRTGYLHQALSKDGRYDETRAGRRHAYQGRFWLYGDRIIYLDDQGFWAFGQFAGGELHHAGYVMTAQ